MNIELEPEVVDAIKNGRRIEAIKKLRELRGLGLKESKKMIDTYCLQNNISAPSIQKVGSGNGLILLIIFGIGGYLLYRYFN